MKEIRITDMTIPGAWKNTTFREKLELARLLDRLHVSAIGLRQMENLRTDSLLYKSIAEEVQSSVLALPVALSAEGVEAAWNAVSHAKHPRLVVSAAVSTVQMEYLYHKKQDAMLETVTETVRRCREICEDVEFEAQDATRADPAFLERILTEAVGAGAGAVTVCDTAGNLLPDEIAAFVQQLCRDVEALKKVTLGVCCANALSLADACSVSALRNGAQAVRVQACGSDTASLVHLVRMLYVKEDYLGCRCTVATTELERLEDQICRLCQSGHSKTTPFENPARTTPEGSDLSAGDDMSAVSAAVRKLGYDLSPEDDARVYEAFRRIVPKKESVSLRELDAIVASAAMQVTPTYHLESYVINTGNIFTATAHIQLKKKDVMVEGVSLGDGPIDAAFLAIEQIIGHHYELDDFQIQSVTEGREAMGQTVVRLRAGGKVYSGRGISTDILGASIRAYLSALNKIVCEEGEA